MGWCAMPDAPLHVSCARCGCSMVIAHDSSAFACPSCGASLAAQITSSIMSRAVKRIRQALAELIRLTSKPNA
jgi:predicted RNA-binding Zn-ribbon protein involved in translation (DUF1610 family)